MQKYATMYLLSTKQKQQKKENNMKLGLDFEYLPTSNSDLLAIDAELANL